MFQLQNYTQFERPELRSSVTLYATKSLPKDTSSLVSLTGDKIKQFIIIFAGEKLLCKPFPTHDRDIRKLTNTEKMACISTCIPFEFNARTLHSQDLERELLEKHMWLCLSVSDCQGFGKPWGFE